MPVLQKAQGKQIYSFPGHALFSGADIFLQGLKAGNLLLENIKQDC